MLLDAALLTSDHIIAATGALVVALGLYDQGVRRSRERRREREIVAGKEKTALERIAASATAAQESARKANEGVAVVVEILKGRPPSWREQNPPPGLVETVHMHGDMLARLIPNGENTNDPGDLMRRMARKQGVLMDDDEIDHHDP